MRPYRQAVETALPPFLIYGMQRHVAKLGYAQTPGIMYEFSRAARIALAAVPAIERRVPELEVKDVCIAMSSDLRPDDPRDTLLACLAFTPLLAENGLHGALTDPLPKLCLQEISDFKTLGQWAINEPWVLDTARRMLSRASMLGYYLDDGFFRDGKFKPE